METSNQQELLSLFSDMYKERYNIRPHWMPGDVDADTLKLMISDLESMPALEDDSPEESDPAMEPFPSEDEAPLGGTEPEDQLPSHSGMGRALRESLMAVLRATILEAKKGKKGGFVPFKKKSEKTKKTEDKKPAASAKSGDDKPKAKSLPPWLQKKSKKAEAKK